jgi:hypothetical protein
MLDGFAKYRRDVPNHRDPYFLPETYRFHVESELNAFSELLGDKNGGSDGRANAWTLIKETNEAKDILLFPPNSKSLDDELQRISVNDTWYYMQKDICEPLTWKDGRNIMVRVFWLVSLIACLRNLTLVTEPSDLTLILFS